ncbi:MAG: PTS transporter subunit EIIC, partial [Carnobacterium sp.]
MTNFLNWIETKFMPPMAKLAEQKHLKAIRDGVISTLSLILVGSFFLIIANPPIPSWAEAIAPYTANIVIPFRITMGLMSIYAAYGMGYSLAKSYKLDGVTGGVLSLATFLMLTVPVNVDALLPEGQGIGWVLPMNNLGGAGMFSAILAMIFAVESLRFFKSRNLMIKMPE